MDVSDPKPERSALGRHFNEFVSGLARWAAAERARRQAIAEIANLDNQGLLDEVLADMSLTRDDLEAVINADPEAPPRLEAMAERLGVTEKIAHMPTRWSHDLALVCKTCPRPEECDRWMRSGATEGFERFCDNAQTLKALREAP
jgi:hypothetical protein